MRYFLIIYAIVAVVVVGAFKYRGYHFTQTPIQIFPDMDDQDKLKAQKPDAFFADGQGSRLPVAHTSPRGFDAEGNNERGGVHEYEFSGGDGYYYTGHVGDYFGNGMPTELALHDEAAAIELLKRGEERFNVYCAICHGRSGDGAGMTSQYGVPGIANLMMFSAESYPNGRLFETITKGKGNMSGYGYNIPVRDRWAIIAYIRAMQLARKAPLSMVKDQFEAAQAQGLVK